LTDASASDALLDQLC